MGGSSTTTENKPRRRREDKSLIYRFGPILITVVINVILFTAYIATIGATVHANTEVNSKQDADIESIKEKGNTLSQHDVLIKEMQKDVARVERKFERFTELYEVNQREQRTVNNQVVTMLHEMKQGGQ